MTAYGPGFTATGVLFEVTNIPDQTMPDAAVADLGTLPAGITPASSLSAWTSGWNGGAGPAWVAQPWENEQAFRQRVIRNCRANGTIGQVVHVWQRAGFWGRNVDGKTIA